MSGAYTIYKHFNVHTYERMTVFIRQLRLKREETDNKNIK